MNPLKVWWLNHKTNRVLNKIIKLRGMSHSSEHSKSEGERSIALLQFKLNKLIQQRWS